ncbi:YybH family protein [Pseudomonas cyclaminis]|uniref:YybH family protein n=1 Tax=Pseudomonas cyclaminis TaxID=2781239 RepID=UPI0037F5E6E7
MSSKLQTISQEVLELERSLNERWSVGDSQGYLDNYHDDISYFDPALEKLLVGRDAVVEHIQKLYKNPHIVRNEYLNPDVIASNAGDLAVLSYNLRTYVAAEQGSERLLRAWNATEVYRKIAGAWRIVHSNWAITQSMTTASAS